MKEENELKKICIVLPSSLVDEIDVRVKRESLKSRSEFLEPIIARNVKIPPKHDFHDIRDVLENIKSTKDD